MGVTGGFGVGEIRKNLAIFVPAVPDGRCPKVGRVLKWMDSNGDVRINGLLKTSENKWDILWLEPVMTSWLLKNVRLEAPSKGFFREERRFGCLTKERIRPADDEGR